MAIKLSERTSKKRKYTSPGGSRRIACDKGRKIKLHCSKCGKELHGIPTNTIKSSKSEKVPNRPYAGVYCSSCSRDAVKLSILEKVKKIGE